MLKKMYLKNIFRTIKDTKGRFISIMALMMLGSFAWVGLKSVGPAMEERASYYFNNLNTVDHIVMSPYGIGKSEEKELSTLSNVEIEYGYIQDVSDNKTSKAIRIFSWNKVNKISNYEVVEGYLPKNSDEIAISYGYRDNYKLGDILEIKNKTGYLERSSFKVVGYINSSEIVSSNQLGNSLAGDGSLAAYAVTKSENFKSPVYSLARLKYINLKDINPFSETYKQGLESRGKELDKILSTNVDKRIAELKSEMEKQSLEAKSEIEKAQAKLAESKANFENVAPFMSVGDRENYKKELEKSERELAELSRELAESKDNKPKLERFEYSILDRSSAPGGEGYFSFVSSKDSLNAVSNIFPLLLYTVAAMVSLTSMTRFVNEERLHSGLFSALGYSRKDIISKFLLYGFFAAVLGSPIGILLGTYLLPSLISDIIMARLTIGDISLGINWKYSLIAFVLTVLTSLVPTYIVSRKELSEKPAALLQAKAPAKASRILLERLPFIWNKLNFTRKVTARNIFRYKQRMFMTIFGVAGSVALLYSGLGIQSSVGGIVDSQFEKIMKYDILAIEKEDQSKEESDRLRSIIFDSNLENEKRIYFESISKIIPNSNEEIDISLMVHSSESLQPMVNLIDNSKKEALSLVNDGVIISPKLAEFYNLKVGDTFDYTRSDKSFKFKVAAIAEFYIGHSIFMNDTYYKEVFGQDFKVNAYLISLKDSGQDKVASLAEKLLASDTLSALVQNNSIINSTNNVVESLNGVMIILVAVSVLLAVVILYNLTKVNIEERIRELSTIKVLGFYNKEVTMYIYRETISLSIIGIIAGLISGHYLHLYIIDTIASKNLIFNPSVDYYVYIISVLAILAIIAVLGFIVNKNLKSLDMLEALKSVD